ncbi:hypothetical protein BU15DRAFT_45324 [Melanogaster broomeanus]|nr:hypothetical protein BU15DRAFT_45324 [Melanogaster broomeanus]
MNSPDPGSPISTDTSGSPPPDESQFTNRDQQQMLNIPNAQLFHNISSSLASGSGSSKRRLPGGSTFEGPSRRDPKLRRREDAMGPSTSSKRFVEGQMAGGSVGPAGGTSFPSRVDYGARRDKEELVDLSLVEQLRQDFGDPFLDSGLKQLS